MADKCNALSLYHSARWTVLQKRDRHLRSQSRFLLREGKFWGLKQDTRRASQPHTVQLLVAFHRRKTTRLEVSIDIPFPKLPKEKQPAPPINVIQQALQVKAYMQANPHETCLSASKTLNLDRKRIARLLKLADTLPTDFIEKAKHYNDPKILHRMSLKGLLRITNSKELTAF